MKLLHLLPFMDQEDMTELLEKIKQGEVKGVKYVYLYPFLNTEELDQLVDYHVEQGSKKEIYAALPFMSNERLSKLYEQVKNKKIEGFKEEALIPFLGQKKIKELVKELIAKGEVEGAEDEDDITVVFDE